MKVAHHIYELTQEVGVIFFPIGLFSDPDSAISYLKLLILESLNDFHVFELRKRFLGGLGVGDRGDLIMSITASLVHESGGTEGWHLVIENIKTGESTTKVVKNQKEEI